MTTVAANPFRLAEVTRGQRSRLQYVMTVGHATPCSMDDELLARELLTVVVQPGGSVVVVVHPEAHDAFDEYGVCMLPVLSGVTNAYLVDVLPPDAPADEPEPFTYTPLLFATTDAFAWAKARAFYGDRAIAVWGQTSPDEYLRAIDG